MWEDSELKVFIDAIKELVAHPCFKVVTGIVEIVNKTIGLIPSITE
jgi:hypothetical protein